MSQFDFPKTAPATVAELWQSTVDILPDVANEGNVRLGISIGTSETPVAHGMGITPKMAIPVPRTNVTVYRTREPDSKCVYLAASTATVCDIWIVP